MAHLPLVLGSSSPYRKALLERLGLKYSCCSPAICEEPLAGESVRDQCQRLSLSKARAVANRVEESLIIASDQLAELEGKIIGKPGNQQNAEQQLINASGKKVIFYTGLCLLNSQTDHYQLDIILYSVYFKVLSEKKIRNYIQQEAPYDCAGSFKSEGLGVSLFKKMAGDDPTSLMGLPLIRLVSMLEQERVSVI